MTSTEVRRQSQLRLFDIEQWLLTIMSPNKLLCYCLALTLDVVKCLPKDDTLDFIRYSTFAQAKRTTEKKTAHGQPTKLFHTKNARTHTRHFFSMEKPKSQLTLNVSREKRECGQTFNVY